MRRSNVSIQDGRPRALTRSDVDAMSDFTEPNRHIRLDTGSVERLELMPVL